MIWRWIVLLVLVGSLLPTRPAMARLKHRRPKHSPTPPASESNPPPADPSPGPKPPDAPPAPAPRPPQDAPPPEPVDVSAALPNVSSAYSEAYPQMDRALDHLTARSTRKNTWNMVISHRNHEGALKQPFHDLLGFDGGQLKIGLGLRYGILTSLDVGMYRTNGTVELFDTYEFDLRYQFLNQKDHSVDMAVRMGISWFSQPSTNRDASGLLAQWLVSRQIGSWLVLGGGVLYHTYSSGPLKSSEDIHPSAALMALSEMRLLDFLAWDWEVTFNVSGYHAKNPVLSLGPRLITNRHTFALVLSNSQYTSADSIITNTQRMSLKDWILGFTITREI